MTRWRITYPNGDGETVRTAEEPQTRNGVLSIRLTTGARKHWPLVAIRSWEEVR